MIEASSSSIRHFTQCASTRDEITIVVIASVRKIFLLVFFFLVFFVERNLFASRIDKGGAGFGLEE